MHAPFTSQRAGEASLAVVVAVGVTHRNLVQAESACATLCQTVATVYCRWDDSTLQADKRGFARTQSRSRTSAVALSTLATAGKRTALSFVQHHKDAVVRRKQLTV